MVTSEIYPFAKSGGLADVVYALSLNLFRLEHDVRIVLPFYGSLNIRRTGGPSRHLSVSGGYGEVKLSVYMSTIPKTEIPVYLIDNCELFGRKGIYGEREVPEYPDNAKRFALFCRSVFSLCRAIEWIPDIFHTHDWPAGPTNAYLHVTEKDSVFHSSATVLTIHNLGYQGIYSKHEIHNTQLDWDTLRLSNDSSSSRLNYLQTGIRFADVLTTVSPTYAREIQQPEHGFSLDAMLRERSEDLYGILNGIDYEEWNPETDPLLPYRFNENEIGNKVEVKRFFQEKSGLPVDKETPLFVMVGRLVEQKGFAELAGPGYGSLYQICHELNVQFVILGTGEQWCEEELSRLAALFDNLSVFIEFDNRMAHIMEAAGDFFLMPSTYEPCGLNQMYSMRYGTLPIVTRTGGLSDTVKEYNPETGEGTGFFINEITPNGIYQAVNEAATVWQQHKDHIKSMRIRAMRERFSWEKSTEEYIRIYQQAIEKKN